MYLYKRSSSRRPLRVLRPPRDRSRLAAPRAPAALRMRSESRLTKRALRAIASRKWYSSRSRWVPIHTRTPPSVRLRARAPTRPPPRRIRAFSGRRRARSTRITRRSRTRRSTRATASPSLRAVVSASPPIASLCRAGRSRSQTPRARCR